MSTAQVRRLKETVERLARDAQQQADLAQLRTNERDEARAVARRLAETCGRGLWPHFSDIDAVKEWGDDDA